MHVEVGQQGRTGSPSVVHGDLPDVRLAATRRERAVDRELLAKLYGVTIAQVGIDPESEPADDPSPTDRSLLSFLDTAAGLFDQLGAAGAVLQPQLFALWKDEIANRRAVFALLGPLTDAPTPTAAVVVDLDTVDQLADTYERLYATADSAALLAPVAAHVRMLGDALRDQLPAGDR
jgi:hypothetical protein